MKNICHNSERMHAFKTPHCLLLLLCCFSCSSSEEQLKDHFNRRNQKGEYIYRKNNESFAFIDAPEKNKPNSYPWDRSLTNNNPKISKEFFRCKGSSLNPSHTVQLKTETLQQYDCNGSVKHSLPLKDGKEFVYPILIELLNHIQEITARPIVITSGHRCPEHNTYADPSPSNRYSKHMIGAEVSFYVQGLEEYPEKIVTIIQNFYKNDHLFEGNQDYIEFQRYTKKDTNTIIEPWFNKEIFVKIYKKNEGRNFDNRHPYPYLSIQVRHDRDTNEKVIYTWDKALHNYRRW